MAFVPVEVSKKLDLVRSWERGRVEGMASLSPLFLLEYREEVSLDGVKEACTQMYIIESSAIRDSCRVQDVLGCTEVRVPSFPSAEAMVGVAPK
jgi:hypothetical protein